MVRHLSFKAISDIYGFRVYGGGRKGAWLVKTNPYQEELSGILCGRELETGSALGCFTVNNFVYIVLNDQAVYVVIKLPLEPILSTNMTNIYTSPCDYLHLSEIRKKLTGVINTESTLKLYSV